MTKECERKVRGTRENEEEERRGKDAFMHAMSWLDWQQAHLSIDLFGTRFPAMHHHWLSMDQGPAGWNRALAGF